MEVLNIHHIRKLYFLVLFSFFFINVGVFHAQTLSVKYQCYYDNAFPKIVPADLFFLNNVSIFEEKLNDARDWKENKNEIFEKLGFSNVSVVKNNPVDVESLFTQRDFSKQQIVFIEQVGNRMYEISDFWIPIDWEITDEKKTISNYECFKAKTIFRGLEWEAWFTSEIPVSIGPWKLYGLPGLILEASSQNKKYSYIVSEINFQSKDTIEFPINKFKKIGIKEMVENRKSINQSINSNLNRSESSIDLSNLIETQEPKYEWEE